MDESQLKRLEELKGMAAPLAREIIGIHIEPPQETYFYEMPNGQVTAVIARDAKNMHDRFKFLGRSDGKKYWQALIEADNLFKAHGKELATERVQLGFVEELEEAKKDLTPPKWSDIIEPRGETGFAL